MQTETAALGADHAQEHAIQREALRRWMALAGRRARADRAPGVAAGGGRGDPDRRCAPGRGPGRPLGAADDPLPHLGPQRRRDRDRRGDVLGPRAAERRRHARQRHRGLALASADRHARAGPGAADGPRRRRRRQRGRAVLLLRAVAAPSGEVLLTGGNLAYPSGPGTDFAGLNTIYSFDPWTRRWTEQPRMRQGRWYPTQVELADGRTVVVAGYDESGAFPTRWNAGPRGLRSGGGSRRPRTADAARAGRLDRLRAVPAPVHAARREGPARRSGSCGGGRAGRAARPGSAGRRGRGRRGARSGASRGGPRPARPRCCWARGAAPRASP